VKNVQTDNRQLQDRSGVSGNVQLCEQFASFEDVPEKGIKKAFFGFIDMDKALVPCISAHKSNPKDTRIQAQLARIYLQQGKFIEAVALARSSMKEQRIALVLLADANRRGIGGLPVNLPEAVKLVEEAVEKGEPEAMAALAFAYTHGYVVAKDERRALDLLRRAADMGGFDASVGLASGYLNGQIGLEKNPNEAIRLLQKPADSGLRPDAEFVLAAAILAREKKLTPEATRYLTSAKEKLERFSDQGSAYARTGLGVIYLYGLGVAKDPARAFELFRMAASHNHVTAIEQVGIAYLDGIGAVKNEIEGRKWLERASTMGSDTADKRLKLLPEAKQSVGLSVVPGEGELRPGKVFKDCSDCPPMVVIPAGSFEMGSNSGNSDAKPVHRAMIGKAFAIGQSEVTQGQWRAIMGNNPSRFTACGDNCPVEQVSWNDAQDYVRRISQKTGQTYRLPSEAEWEYACRAGVTHTNCGSDDVDSVAWHTRNSSATTHAVAGKQANAWGLYDMSGNVWEWTQDCWNASYSGAPGDGSAWAIGNCSLRVVRGGSWDIVGVAMENVNFRNVRAALSALRSGNAAVYRGGDYGFRLAKTLF
jgi:formylglycine-generating enzyme required for sulfatase activity